MRNKEKKELLTQIQEIIKDNEERIVPLSSLLLKAKRLAMKLEGNDFENFINTELDGYQVDEKVPRYRIVQSVPIGILQNSITGVTNEIQLDLEELFKSVEMDFDHAYQRTIPHSISFLEHFEKDGNSGQVAAEFLPQQLTTLKKYTKVSPGWFFKSGYFKLSGSVFIEIILTVRKLLQDHLLKFEQSIIDSINGKTETFFEDNRNFDAALAITKILEESKKEIILIDGYIDEQTLKYFCFKKEGLLVKILTNSKSTNDKFNLLLNSFNQQYKNLEVKTSNAFHDRFIIIDNTNFYHIGSSIKDVGKHAFMYSKIVNSYLKNAILQKFNSEWE